MELNTCFWVDCTVGGYGIYRSWSSLSTSSVFCLWMKVMSQLPVLATMWCFFHHDELYDEFVSKQIITSLSWFWSWYFTTATEKIATAITFLENISFCCINNGKKLELENQYEESQNFKKNVFKRGGKKTSIINQSIKQTKNQKQTNKRHIKVLVSTLSL